MEVFRQWPLLTRYMVVGSFSMSALVYGGLLSYQYIPYVPQTIFTYKRIPQIWRLITSFLLTGPQYSIIMDPYFLFQYSSALEKESSKFSELGSYFVYLVFNAAIILGLSGHYFGGYTFMQALILAIAYTFSQENPDRQMSIFILTFPGKYLPLALLAMTLVLAGANAAQQQAMGLISAHLYEFLTRVWPEFGGGRRWIQTPAVVKQWFGGEPGTRPAPQARGFGTSIGAAAPRAAPGASTGSNWSGQRGPGRRLGSD